MTSGQSRLKRGMEVRHTVSGWSGPIDHVERQGQHDSSPPRVWVRPTHPRPREVWDGQVKDFVPTPADWPGWKLICVNADELEPA